MRRKRSQRTWLVPLLYSDARANKLTTSYRSLVAFRMLSQRYRTYFRSALSPLRSTIAIAYLWRALRSAYSGASTMATACKAQLQASADIEKVLRAFGLQGEEGECTMTVVESTGLIMYVGSASTAFDIREAHRFPFEHDVVFLAVYPGSSPRYQHEDGVRWHTAIGCAILDTRTISHLSPGKNGLHWAEKIVTETFTIEGRQAHSTASRLIHGPDMGEVTNVAAESVKKWHLERLLEDGSRQVIIVDDNLRTSLQCELSRLDFEHCFHER